MDLINWIMQNYQTILSIFFGVVFVASVIVRLTPTTKDDTALRSIVSFLDNFSVVKTADDKEVLERAKKHLDANPAGNA